MDDPSYRGRNKAALIDYRVTSTGKWLGWTKKRVSWEVDVGLDEHHLIELTHTIWSGKKVIFHNGQTLYKNLPLIDSGLSFTVPYLIASKTFKIIVDGDGDDWEYYLNVDGAVMQNKPKGAYQPPAFVTGGGTTSISDVEKELQLDKYDKWGSIGDQQ